MDHHLAGPTGNNLTTGTTILDGIKRAVAPSTDVVYSENPDAGFVQQNKARFDYTPSSSSASLPMPRRTVTT